MKKLVFLTAAGAVLALAARRACSTMCNNVDWEQKVEAMPDGCSPKWMFRNVTAIRDNTERIIDLLQREPSRAAPQVVATG